MAGESLQDILKRVLDDNPDILSRKDELCSLLNGEIPGRLRKDYSAVEKAIKDVTVNAGEIFAMADRYSESEMAKALGVLKDRLILTGMQADRVQMVCDCFAYALPVLEVQEAPELTTALSNVSLTNTAPEPVMAQSLPIQETVAEPIPLTWYCHQGHKAMGNFCGQCGESWEQAQQEIVYEGQSGREQVTVWNEENQGVEDVPVYAHYQETSEGTSADKELQAFNSGEQTTPAADESLPEKRVNKKIIGIVLLVLLAIGGFFGLSSDSDKSKEKSIKAEQNIKPRDMLQGTNDNINNKQKREENLPKEALLSKDVVLVRQFKDELVKGNKKAMASAKDVIWITMDIYKNNNDIFVDGAYYNGGKIAANCRMDMHLDIHFYGQGKEVGYFSNVKFDKIDLGKLQPGKLRKVRYKILGRANEVGDFSTFQAVALIKKW